MQISQETRDHQQKELALLMDFYQIEDVSALNPAIDSFLKGSEQSGLKLDTFEDEHGRKGMRFSFSKIRTEAALNGLYGLGSFFTGGSEQLSDTARAYNFYRVQGQGNYRLELKNMTVTNLMSLFEYSGTDIGDELSSALSEYAHQADSSLEELRSLVASFGEKAVSSAMSKDTSAV